VLEADLVLHNGVSLPLLSEFLNYAEGEVAPQLTVVSNERG
jgi:hypothetical protein